MVRVINFENAPRYRFLLDAMHRDRKRVFIDILRWPLPHEGERERDAFDDADAEYLVLEDPLTGDHQASLRLLRTCRAHLMSEVFPHLCEQGVPSGPCIREVTRLCLSPRLRARERQQARNRLIRGLVQYALAMNICVLTGVSEQRFLTQVLSAGWDCVPLGQLRRVEGSLIGAFQINLDEASISSLIPSWQCAPDDRQLLELDRPLAA